MSVVFDGIGDYVDLNSLNEVETQSALTIALFAKVTTAADFKVIFGKQFSGSSRVLIQVGGSGIGDNNEVVVSVSNGSTCNGNTSGANILALNTWVHLALVFDGGGAANADRIKLYADGVQKTLTFSGTAPTTTPNDTAHGFLGGLTTTNNLTGKIAEVGIWQAALTSTQAADLAGGDKPDTIPTGLVFYAALKDDITDAEGATITANGNAAIDADHPTMNGGGATTIAAGAGSFAATGQAATLKAARKLSAGAGSFALTGQDVTLTGPGAKSLAADVGTFTFTGQAVNFEVAVPAGIASYTLTGQAAGLRASRRLAAGVGSFVLSGQAVALEVARKLAASVGSIALTGQSVTLTYSGAPAGTPRTPKTFTAPARRNTFTVPAS